MSKNGTLSPKQLHFVELYMTSPSTLKAAELAGISRRTAERYIKDPAVRAAIAALQDQKLRQAAANVATAMGEAVAVLRLTMFDESAPPSTRANAAGRLLESGLKLQEMIVLSQRLDDLEARVGRAR